MSDAPAPLQGADTEDQATTWTSKAICDDLFSSGELTDVVSEIVRAKRMGMTMTGEKAVDSLLSKFDSCAFFMAGEKLK